MRVSPTGKRTWIVQARVNRQPRRFSLGIVGDMKIAEARNKATEMKASLLRGENPIAERKREAAADVTLGDFWTDYLSRHHDLQPVTLKSYSITMKSYVLPQLRDVKVRDITRAEAWKMHSAIIKAAREGQTNQRTANKAVQVLRLVLSNAEGRGVIPHRSNPLRDMKLRMDAERSVFLSDEQIERTFAALDAKEGRGVSPMSTAFLKTMLLTGARGGELQRLEWKHVDESKKIATLPKGKNGDPRVIPLGGAWEIIDALPRAGRLVFWGRSPELPFVMFREAWRRVREEAGLGSDVKPHDLRHSFASAVLAQNFALPIVGGLLGHRSVASTKRYAHLAPSAINAVAEIAAGAIMKAAKGGSATGKVVR